MPKILLIEDDAMMVGLLKTLLKIEGYEVVAFNRVKMYCQTDSARKTGLIILDVNLKKSWDQWIRRVSIY